MILRRLKFGESGVGTTNDRSDGHNGTMSVESLRQTATENAAASSAVQELASALGGHINHCFLVGGAVRDFALGREPNELDVLVAGNAHELLSQLGLEGVSFHERFLTATAGFSFGTVDFASARRETYSGPGALPDIELCEVEEDRLRRDFTVNALRIELSSFETIDDEQGWQDLHDRVLRSLRVGSFLEDPTRIWRLARYAGRLGFTVESGTQAEAESALASGAMESVSKQRIGAELVRTVDENEPDASILAALAWGLIESSTSPDDAARAISRMTELVDGSVPRSELRLAAVAGSGFTLDSADGSELELGAGLMAVLRDITRVGELVKRLESATTPSQIDEACSGWAPAVVALVGERSALDKVSQWFREIRTAGLPFGGADLLSRGVQEGPALGIGLKAARAAMLDEGVTDYEKLLEIAVAEAGGES